MVKKGLENLEHPSVGKQTEIEYRVYSQLYMAKHANPLLQMDHGFIIHEGNVVAIKWPQYVRKHYKSRLVRHGTCHSTCVYCSPLLYKIPLETEGNEDLVSQLWSLGEARKQLEGEAKKRWGAEDPFQGKW